MGVTIKDIAKEAGVSAMTVSRVVNHHTSGISDGKRREIQALIDRMGYRPNALARGLVTHKTNVLGLVLPNIVDPFFPEIARGVQDAAGRQGYNVILCNTDDRPEEETAALELLKEKCVDGILFYSSGFLLREAALRKLLLEENDTPVALIGNRYDGISIPSVYVDFRKAMKELTIYLHQFGHRRIAYLPGMIADPHCNEGLSGYLEAVTQLGLEADHALIRLGRFTLEGANAAVVELLKQKLPFTAIITENDMMAMGVLEALAACGLDVPGDVSVVSLDNTMISRFITPSLTTVDLPKYELGHRSACLLMETIVGHDVPQRTVELPFQIIERNTVAVPKTEKKVCP